MRNGQNKRMRGRNHHHHRKNQNPLTRVYESNGPEVKIRGTASHVAEKYVQLARDATTSGDPVTAENYHQHAEHYLRLIAAAQEQFRQQNPYYRPEGEMRDDNVDNTDDAFDDGDDTTAQPMHGQPMQGQPMQGQPNVGNQQPYPPRESQPYGGRDQQHHQGRPQHHHNQQNQHHQHNQQHPHQQHQPHQPQQHQPPQQNPNMEGNDGERLPSFITGGGQPQQNSNQNGYDNQGGDRYQMHRRRRRHRGHQRHDSPGGQGAGGNDMPHDPRADND